MPHLAYIGLGTNLCKNTLGGTRQQQLTDNLNKAVNTLQEHVGTLLKCSSFINTQPWGFESDNDFLNGVALFETRLTPMQLLKATQQAELQMGRTTKSHNNHYHDRIIDLDILFYDNMVVNTPQLTIPHPQIEQRDFVLIPLEEIAPHIIHPTLHKTIQQLLYNLQGQQP